jgi:hypothetical protein
LASIVRLVASLAAHSFLFLVGVKFLSDFKVDGEAHGFLHRQQGVEEAVLHDIAANMSELLRIAHTSIHLHHTRDVLRAVTGQNVQQRALATSTRPDDNRKLSSAKLPVEVL